MTTFCIPEEGNNTNKLPWYAGIKGKWALSLRERTALLCFITYAESDVTASVCLSVSKITNGGTLIFHRSKAKGAFFIHLLCYVTLYILQVKVPVCVRKWAAWQRFGAEVCADRYIFIIMTCWGLPHLAHQIKAGQAVGSHQISEQVAEQTFWPVTTEQAQLDSMVAAAKPYQ